MLNTKEVLKKYLLIVGFFIPFQSIVFIAISPAWKDMKRGCSWFSRSAARKENVSAAHTV